MNLNANLYAPSPSPQVSSTCEWRVGALTVTNLFHVYALVYACAHTSLCLILSKAALMSHCVCVLCACPPVFNLGQTHLCACASAQGHQVESPRDPTRPYARDGAHGVSGDRKERSRRGRGF